MEKKVLRIITLLYLLPFWVKSQEPVKQPFSLKGKIYGKKSGTIYINGRYNGVNDSCKLKNGHFAFKGFIAEPSKIIYTLSPKFGGVLNGDNETEVYIEPANMDISVHLNDFRHIKLTGSVTDKDRVTLDKAKEKLDAKIRPLNIQNLKLSNLFNAKKREGADSNILVPMHKQLDSIYHVLVALLHEQRLIDSLFIIQHPASYVTLIMLWTVISFDDIKFTSIEKLYNRFPEKIRRGYLGTKIWNVLLQQKKTEIGALIDNFISLDTKGDTIELRKYKNKKYVLLDF